MPDNESNRPAGVKFEPLYDDGDPESARKRAAELKAERKERDEEAKKARQEARAAAEKAEAESKRERAARAES